MSKILVAGPWIGEFGWELFGWQGYIRAISKNYVRTICISRPGHGVLYTDFAEFVAFDPEVDSSTMWMAQDKPRVESKIYYPSYIWLNGIFRYLLAKNISQIVHTKN